MIRRLLSWPYRFWLRQDLKWIEDRIADERDHYARHDLLIRALQADAADIRWKLDGGPSRRVVALWPRDPIGRPRT